MSDESERRQVFLVYVGVENRKGKQHHRWLEIESLDVNDGRPYTNKSLPASGVFKKNLLAGISIGTVISADANEDSTSIFVATCKIVDSWQNEDDLLEWRAYSRAQQGEAEAEHKVAKELRRDLPAEALAPFKRAHQVHKSSKEARRRHAK